jgi:hypothetical protein
MKLDLKTSIKIIIVLLAVFLVGGAMFSPSFSKQITKPDNRIAYAAESVDQHMYLPIILGFESSYSKATLFGVEFVGTVVDYKDLDRLNAHWARRNGLEWSRVEKVEGVYDWGNVQGLETNLIETSEMGLEVILVVRSTPEWAQEDYGSYCGPIKDSKRQAFANFMYEAVKRYSMPPYNVKYWQIWNEPDMDRRIVDIEPERKTEPYGCWGDATDGYFGGGEYADVLEVVTPRIKQANPQAQVVVGGLMLPCSQALSKWPQACNHQEKYLEGILRHNGAYDGGNYFDVVAFHAYDFYWNRLGKFGNGNWGSSWKYNGVILTEKYAFLKDVLTRYGYGNKPLMASENALLCGSDGTEPVCLTREFEETKAYYVVQTYTTALTEGGMANIWYALRVNWRGSGLLDNYGNPLPAYHAYGEARNRLMEATFTRELYEYGNVKGYEFHSPERDIWVMWSQVEGADLSVLPTSVVLPTIPDAVYDVYGNPVYFNGNTLTVNAMPLYIEWER